MTGLEEVLREAQFDRKVRWYWLWYSTLILVLTIFGIVLVPIFWLVGLTVTERYLRRLRCSLGSRSLRVEKGLLVRVEKTIPLDKITDVGLVEGPLMRALGLQALSVETAGQTGRAGGALVTLTGIIGAREFRDEVLKARDRLVFEQGSGMSGRGSSEGTEAGSDGAVVDVLRDIRSILERVEGREAGGPLA